MPKFEYQISIHLARYIDDVIAVVKEHSNEYWQEIKPECQQLRLQAETLERGAELIQPTPEEGIESTLWWMSVRGTENDLSLLTELQKHPSYSSAERSALLSEAIGKIQERLEKENLALTQAEKAYQRHKDAWDRQYAGQYVAIAQGKVIDTDPDKTRLTARLIKKQRETALAPAYVMYIHDPTRLTEEIHDLENYLAALPPDLRASGTWASYETRLERLRQQLAGLQPAQPVKKDAI